jgi:hypothetical protein
MIRWAGYVAYIAEKRNAYRDLVGEPEGNVSLGRAKHRYVYNIKMDLKDCGRPWVGLIWFRIGANVAMNLQVAQNVGNFLTS